MNQDTDHKQPENQLMQRLAAGVAGTVFGGGILAAVLVPQYRNALLILLLTLILVGVIAGGAYLFWRSRKRKRRNVAFEGGMIGAIDEQSGRSSDHDQKARLESIKRKFMLLIERLRAEGNQNIYEMPWFLTIGPSGTGKTWVLKACGLEPLEDSDWKKGTFLMDWWTCGEALVLDTAGGLVFGEEKGDHTDNQKGLPDDWKSLLDLLRKHRPQCPINGLFVVIPSQLLWLKPDEIPAGWLNLEEYAEALRLQVRKQLQRTLGVRFPIYFLVTQSDRLPGFREFADALEANGNPCGQMLGWSNPVNVGQDKGRSGLGRRHRRDVEYDPTNEIADSLRQVVQNLSRQRLVLLNKYAGESARTDEVGMAVRERAAELFAFPDAIQSTLAPRLQDFLETVFRPDPMLPKPPYLRGIYFTSALREGEVLDRERVRTGGKSLADLALPGGADRKQPKPFFLKDIFYEKAFPEAWLVTPLVEAGRYLKQRRQTLIWASIGATTLLLAAIGIGGLFFRGTVGGELEEWKKIKTIASNPLNRYWLPVVDPAANGSQVLTNYVDAQVKLAFAARARLKGTGFWSFGWLFRSSALEKPRREAQLKLFERGVLRPLADSTLSLMKMKRQADVPPPSETHELQKEIRRFEGALLAVLELELCNQALKGPDLEKSRDRVVDGCLNYLLPDGLNAEASYAKSLIKTAFDATYSDDYRREKWPPDSAKQGQSFSNFVTSAFQQLTTLHNKHAMLLGAKQMQLEGLEKQLLTAFETGQSTSTLQTNLLSLKINWNALLQEMRNSQHQSFADFASEADQGAGARREQFLKQLQQVNGAMRWSGTNLDLVGVLKQGFRLMVPNLPKSTPDSSNVGSSPQPPAARGQEVRPNVEPRRLLDQRIEIYQSTIEISPQLPRDWDSIDDASQRPAKNIADEIASVALKTWAGLPTNVVLILTIYNRDYSGVLSNYTVYRHFESALQRGRDQITNLLVTSMPANSSEPKDMLRDIQPALGLLNRMQNLCDAFRPRLQQMSYGDVAPLGLIRSAIQSKREKLLATVKGQIDAEEEVHNKGFPLENRSSKIATELEVRKSWKRAAAWRDAIRDLTGDEKLPGSLPKVEPDKWEKLISPWLDQFKQLLDAKGEILEYEVTTPWGVPEFERVPTDMRSAKVDAGKYRAWEWDQKWLDPAEPKAKPAPIAADKGFTLAVRTALGAQEKKPTTIDVAPRSGGWTIIDLLRRQDTKQESMTYYVPIAVDGDKGPAKVWFVIRPVEQKK